MDEPGRPASPAARIVLFLQVVRERLSRPPSAKAQRALLAVAAGVFVGGAVVSARALGLEAAAIDWAPLGVAALIGVPLTAACNAGQYAVSARILGHRVSPSAAGKVSVLGTAANFLPIPGAVVVRVQALRQLGMGYRRAVSSTISVALAWVGLAALLAGAWLFPVGALLAGGLLALLGAAILVCAGVLLAVEVADTRRRLRLAGAVLGVQTASVAVGAFRLYLVLAAIGVRPTVTQAVVLTLALVLASAVGIVPGGLGLREALAAAFAPLLALPAPVGFLTTAVDRVVDVAVHALLALGVLWHTRRQGREQASESTT